MKPPITLPQSTRKNQESARRKAYNERSLAYGAQVFSDILLGLTRSVPTRKFKKTSKY